MEALKHRVFYGYIVVAASFYIMIIAWGTNRSFGVFLAPMLTEFGWTRAGISGAFTTMMLVTGGMSIVTGRLTDRAGPRVVLVGCGLFLGTSYILVSQVKIIWQFYLYYGVLAGIGLSGFLAPLMSIVVRWFEKRRALMTGILMAGPVSGIVFIPLASSVLISAYGWRSSYLILGGTVLVVITTGALFLKRDPMEMGLLPYGSEKEDVREPDVQVEGASLYEAVRTVQFWLLTVVAASDSFLVNAVTVHIVIHASGLGIGPTAAASVLSVAAGVSIPARIVMGGVADTIGNRLAIMVCLFMGIISFLLLLVAREILMLYVFAALYGFGLWATFGIISAMTAEFFGLESHGTIYGCIVLTHTIGGAMGPVVSGYLFDLTGSYRFSFLICAVVSIMGFIAIFLVRPVTDKRRMNWLKS